jgi:hypothetical protein
MSLSSATSFFVRLGFEAPSESEKSKWPDYLILNHPDGIEVHLRQISPDEEGWLQPQKNPFGIYFHSIEVERLAKEFGEEIIEPAKKPEVKEWGTYEFSVNGPDGCLVRIGCPVDQIRKMEG